MIRSSKKQGLDDNTNMSMIASSLLRDEIRQRINRVKQDYLINKGTNECNDQYNDEFDQKQIESEILQDLRIKDNGSIEKSQNKISMYQTKLSQNNNVIAIQNKKYSDSPVSIHSGSKFK